MLFDYVFWVLLGWLGGGGGGGAGGGRGVVCVMVYLVQIHAVFCVMWFALVS